MKNKSKYGEQNRKHWQMRWFMYSLGFSGEFSSNPGIFGWIRINLICLWRYCWRNLPSMSDDIKVLSDAIGEDTNPHHNFFEVRPDDVTGLIQDWMQNNADFYEFIRLRDARETYMWANNHLETVKAGPNINARRRSGFDTLRRHKRKYMKVVLGSAQRFGIISKETKVDDYLNSAKQRQKAELEKKLREKLGKPLEELKAQVEGRY